MEITCACGRTIVLLKGDLKGLKMPTCCICYDHKGCGTVFWVRDGIIERIYPPEKQRVRKLWAAKQHPMLF